MGVVFGLIITLALISLGFEIIFFGVFFSARARGKILGSSLACKAVHGLVLVVNLYLHWGTIPGTTSAMFAFCMSPIALMLSKRIYGFFVSDETFRHGLIRYSAREVLDDAGYATYINALLAKAKHELTKFETQELQLYAQA
jgi:hypothetical protein